jgi:hypothetical protein
MNEPTPIALTDVYGTGRDAGKTFRVPRIDPLTFAGYALRLVAALRVESYEGLLVEIRDRVDAGDAPIDTIMRVLQGCDPQAVHQLIKDVLTHVTIAPDPQHPGVNRALMGNDILELKTLGDLLMTVSQIHFGTS